MSGIVKYRIHELAKDFGLQSKEIMKIMAMKGAQPKNHMQVLTDEELNYIFDYITFTNQIESIEQVFQTALQVQKTDSKQPEKAEPVETVKEAATEKPEQDKPDQKTAAAETAAPAKTARQDQQPGQKPQHQTQPQQPHQQQPQQPQRPQQEKKGQQQPQRPRERRVVDTRSAAVNLSKYDDRVEKLVPESAEKFQAGKQRIKPGPSKGKSANYSNKRRQEEQDKIRRLQLEIVKKTPLKVLIPNEISVGELAARMKKTGAQVVKQLMKLGIMASLSEIIDYDTAALVAMEMGCKVEKEVVVSIEEKLIDDSADEEKDLVPRSPVVVVMGHVDHGKTSLLDYIRKTHVAAGEAGGITQHIGAYQVNTKGATITFLDTPGHEAFTAMRARGAMVTDIAILVVAADDGIMPQTVEAINHAKAANVNIIVAINKMDKPGANPERIKQQLTEYGLLPEEWGGDTVICPISALTGEGIDNLLDMVILSAEMAELRANPDRAAMGTVLEARLDKGRGPVTTLLVQNGTLRQGDIIIAGTAVGRVRAMTDDKGNKITSAGPSVPVEVIGMDETPGAGDRFHAVNDERMARDLVQQRKQEEKDAHSRSVTKVTLEDLFAQIQEGQVKDLNLIVKADVQGSVEAVRTNLEKFSNAEVKVRVIHSGVGAISESDIMLASTSNAIIIGFNVRPDSAARESAARNDVQIRLYRVIYECIEEMQAAIKGLLAPQYREVFYGRAEVRMVYKVSGVGSIAGCYVREGKIHRGSKARVLRDNVVVYEGELSSLRRFKDDVKEVAAGYECGIGIERFNDIKEGDVIETFGMEQIKD